MTKETIIPAHKGCFVCDTTVPTGLGIQWLGGADGQSLRGAVTLTEVHQGPPKHAHGGIPAAILDDAMGTCAWFAGYMVMTAQMTVNYRRPVPLGMPLTAHAQVVKADGRKIYTAGQLRLEDGSVAVETDGLFIVVEEMFRQSVEFEERFSFLAQMRGGAGPSSGKAE